MRLFVTSEHTSEQIDRAAEIIIAAAETFGFAGPGASAAPVQRPERLE
jgi:hypothetical protein